MYFRTSPASTANGAGEAPYASFFIEFQNICNSSSSNNICTSQSSSNIVLHKIPLIFVFHRVPFIVAYFFQISNKSTIWERSALVARRNLVLIGSTQSRSNWFSKFRSSSAWNLPTNYRKEHSTSSARHPFPASKHVRPSTYAASNQPHKSLGIKVILSQIIWPSQQGLIQTITISSSSS